jgi:hypothetical protein
MNSRRLSILVALVVLLVSGVARANWIGNICIEEPSHSCLPNGVKLWVYFDYKVTNPDGVRFEVKPQFGGADVAGYTWSGSPLIPVGSGAHSSWFAFWSGTHTVDHYLIEMLTPDWNTVLLSISLPVTFHVGDHSVAHLAPSHTSPSWLAYGQPYTIDFDYGSTEAAGVKIFARPFHGGALAGGYVASGSDVLPTPGGSGDQWFRYDSGTHHVDQVRFQMWNATQTVLLLEFFTQVDLTWGPHGLANFTLTPGAPEHLGSPQTVTVEFDYATSATDGVYIWAYAADTPGHVALGQTHSSSPLLMGPTGHLTRSFSFASSDAEHAIPWVWVRMANVAITENLVSVNLPVAYHWGPHAIRNIAYAPRPPAVLDNGEHVDITFDYVTTAVSGARIWVLPLTDGDLSPSAGVSSSPLYPTGSGSGDGFVTILSGQVAVDQIQYRMWDAGTSARLLEFPRDAQFFFGGPGFVTGAPEPIDLPAPVVILGAAYPNPFNPVARIPVTLARAAPVRLILYDVRGRLVRTLVSGALPAGRTEVELRADDLPSGAYFCALKCGDVRQTQRVMLVK